MHRHCIFNYFVSLLGKCAVYMVHVWRLEDKLLELFLSTVWIPGMARVRPSAKGLYPLIHFVGPLIFLKIQSITAELPFPPALVIKSVHR